MEQKKKPVLLIVEAPQGGGKTTLTNMLRDGITSSILLRLAGTPELNKLHPYEYHKAYLNTIKDIGFVGLNHILDRSYITEQVYARLGFKPYMFEDCALYLHDLVASMCDVYDVHYILLMADEDAYFERLQRDKPQYSVAKFSVENSIKQLNVYKDCFKEIEDNFKEIEDNFSNKVSVHYIDNSKMSEKETYDKVLELVGLKEKAKE